jgi:hypothetical protein
MALSSSSLSPPSSQPSGRRLLAATGSSTNPSSLQTRLSHRLNPDATPNTPSSTPASAQEGDLPEWLIFSLSSLKEGRHNRVAVMVFPQRSRTPRWCGTRGRPRWRKPDPALSVRSMVLPPFLIYCCR